MSDKIKEAIQSYKNGKQRVARGTVDGHTIHIIKRKELFGWKFVIDVDSSTEFNERMSAESAELDFNHYKNIYDLEEVE